MLVWLHENEHGHETWLQKADVDATTVELQLSKSSIRQKPREGASRPKRKNAESRVLHGETQNGTTHQSFTTSGTGLSANELVQDVLHTPPSIAPTLPDIGLGGDA